MQHQKQDVHKVRAFAGGQQNIFETPGTGDYLTIAGSDHQIDYNTFQNKDSLGKFIAIKGTAARSLKDFGYIIIILKHIRTRETAMALKHCNLVLVDSVFLPATVLLNIIYLKIVMERMN